MSNSTMALDPEQGAGSSVPASVRRAARSFRKNRAHYYEHVAGKLKASRGNMKVLQLFETDAERYPNHPRGILSAYWRDVYSNNGANLADAWQGTLPDDEVSIIRISQDAGDGALLTALQDVSRIAKLTDKVKWAVIGTLAAGLIGILIALVMATLYPMYAAAELTKQFGFVPVEHWGPKGKAFVAHAERVKLYGIYFVVLLGLAIGYVQWTINNLTGSAREYLDQKVSLYKVIRDIKGALFLSTMATLTRKRGNVMFTLRESLSTFGASVKSPWMRWRVQQVVDGIDATGGVGSDAFNTNLLSKDMFYFLRDTQEQIGFAEGFEETGKYVESTILDGVLLRMTVYRWVLLGIGLATVVTIVGWQGAVIYEMKSTMQTYFTSQ